MFESMTNQQHVMVLDKLEASALENVYDKFDLDVEGMVPLRIGTLKFLHDEDSHKSGLKNPDGDNDVSDTLSNMVAKSQVHKEFDGHGHEADDGDNNNDHDLEDEKTLSNEVICKNENIILDCDTNTKMLRMISKNIQSMDEMFP